MHILLYIIKYLQLFKYIFIEIDGNYKTSKAKTQRTTFRSVFFKIELSLVDVNLIVLSPKIFPPIPNFIRKPKIEFIFDLFKWYIL